MSHQDSRCNVTSEHGVPVCAKKTPARRINIMALPPAPPISMLRLHGLTTSKLYKIGRSFRTAQPFKFDVALATLRSGGSGGSEWLAGHGGRLFRTYLTKMNHLNARKSHSFCLVVMQGGCVRRRSGRLSRRPSRRLSGGCQGGCETTVSGGCQDGCETTVSGGGQDGC